MKDGDGNARSHGDSHGHSRGCKDRHDIDGCGYSYGHGQDRGSFDCHGDVDSDGDTDGSGDGDGDGDGEGVRDLGDGSCDDVVEGDGCDDSLC